MSNSSESFEERRPARRVAVNLETSFTSAGLPACSAHVSEISTSGLRLCTSERLPVGVFVDLDIKFDLDPRNRRLRLLGQVVRLIPGDGRSFEYGVKVVGDHIVKGALRAAVLQLSLKAPAKDTRATVMMQVRKSASWVA